MSSILTRRGRKLTPIIGVLAVLALLLVLLIRPGGIGGTGIGSGEEGNGGIGGTGIGHISQTGYVGRIDGFGSIFVNGAEIEYADTLPIRFNTHIGTVADLKIGHVVEALVTTAQDGTIRAVQIRVRHEVIGPVEAVNGQSLQILSQTILVPSTLNIPNLGAYIAVSGFRRLDGVIVASRLDPAQGETSTYSGSRPFEGQTSNLSLSGFVGPDNRLYGYVVNVAQDIPKDTRILVSGDFSTSNLEITPVRSDPVLQDSVPLTPNQNPAPIIPVPVKRIQQDTPVRTPILTPVKRPVVTERPEPSARPTLERAEKREPVPDLRIAPVEPAPTRENATPEQDPVPEPRESEFREEPDAVRPEEEVQERVEETLEETPATNTEDVPQDVPQDVQRDVEPVEREGASERTEPVERPGDDYAERPASTDRPDRVERPERAERPSTLTRPDRPERPERPERPRR
ncbi:MAG: hypothetical protein COA69_11375 [Robiginitomaculum sp.]|nr:MAG: hypothetical protein COA69_11375 [Robiginitomaculum sp.]